MIVWFLFGFSTVISAVVTFLLIRATRRLLQFDTVFTLLVDDIDVNIRTLDKATANSLTSNAPEVVQFHKNMQIMRDRLQEYIMQIGELTLKKEMVLYDRSTSGNGANSKSNNPPVVV